MDEFQVVTNIDNLSPNTAYLIGRITSDFSKDSKSFNIFYSARNGFFTQTERMIKVNDIWESKTIVSEMMSGNILLERTSENYPKEAE